MEDNGVQTDDPVDATTQIANEYAANIDTQSQQPTSPVTDSDGNDVYQDEIQDSSEATQEPVDEETESIRDARYAGKLKQIEEERNRYKEEKEALQARFSKVVNTVAKSPETLKDALITTNGWSEEQAGAYVDNLKGQGYWKTNTSGQPVSSQVPNQPATNQYVDPHQAAREVIAEEVVRIETQDALTDLIESYPELKTTSDVNYNNAQQALYMAKAWKSANPGLSLKDAIKQQYALITGKSQAQMQSMADTARIEGMAQANAVRSATGTQPIAQTTKQKNFNLSPEQKAAASAFGMSDEAYFKRTNEKVTMVD